MQTFLPYPSFANSAACLDKRRAWKQCLEAHQLLNILESGKTNGPWANHPACRMWRGYRDALALYYNFFLAECVYLRKIKVKALDYRVIHDIFSIEYPEWVGRESFHASHRSNLLRKDNVFYSQYNWREPNNLPYEWPIQ